MLLFLFGIKPWRVLRSPLSGWLSKEIIAGMLALCSHWPLQAQTAGPEEQQNLIANPQFAEGSKHWWGPGWRITQGAGSDGKGPALEVMGGYAAQDKRPARGSVTYRVSVRAKAESAERDSAYVQVSFRGPGVSPNWRGTINIQVDGRREAAVIAGGVDSTWRTFTGLVESPPNATEVLVYLRKRPGSPGSVFYEDVRVSPVGPASAVPPETARRRDDLVKKLFPLAEGIPADPSTSTSGVPAWSGASPAVLQWALDGQARVRIAASRSSDLITLQAAADLADYLGQISGTAFLPLTDRVVSDSDSLIVVGRGALADRLCPDIPYETLGSDGFVIRTVGRSLVIAGATPRGTMYGVNWLLDRKLGVRWLAPNITYVPQRANLTLQPINERQMPRFAYREVLSAEAEDKHFRAHNLLNGESHGPSYSASPPAIDSWDRSWAAKGGTASFHELLPPAVHAKAHPDWFAGGQVAMMNPEVRRQIAAAIIKRLERLPDYTKVWFVVHDMDWGWDMDDASRAFAAAHGGHPSAPRLDMMIDVADQVRAQLPDAKLGFNAYHWSFTPPTGMKIPDYVMVFPMTIHVDYSSALNKGRNSKLGADIEAWSTLSKNVIVWDHITNFAGFIQPTPNIYPIAESIKWLAGLSNVKGYFGEGSWFTPGAEFASLRAWLIARLLWNPDQDPKELVNEYCGIFYGAAGDFIFKYIDLMHEAIKASGDILAEKSPPEMRMFDANFIRAADTLFDKAEQSVAARSDLLARVQSARMSVDYIALVLRQRIAADAARTRKAWRSDESARLERLKAAVQFSKLRRFRQDGSLDALYELLAIERHDARQPSLPARNSPQEWKLYQDLSLNQYDTARVVADDAASDGAAVRMAGKSTTWAVQFKLDRLPPVGAWDLYALVRVKAADGNDSATAARIGRYPPMNESIAVSVGELNDGKYHYIKVPGGPFRQVMDHGSGVYVQAGGLSTSEFVYVDGILAVRSP